MIKRIILLGLLASVAVLAGVCYFSASPPAPNSPEKGETAKPADTGPGDLLSLSFSESHSYRERVEGYAFHAEGDKNTVSFELADWDEPYLVFPDQAWADEMNEMIRQYKMHTWDGFHERLDGLLDGDGFSITLKFSDGAVVTAGGYGRFPMGYGDASRALEAHFLQLLPEEMRSW